MLAPGWSWQGAACTRLGGPTIKPAARPPRPGAIWGLRAAEVVSPLRGHGDEVAIYKISGCADSPQGGEVALLLWEARPDQGILGRMLHSDLHATQELGMHQRCIRDATCLQALSTRPGASGQHEGMAQQGVL